MGNAILIKRSKVISVRNITVPFAHENTLKSASLHTRFETSLMSKSKVNAIQCLNCVTRMMRSKTFRCLMKKEKEFFCRFLLDKMTIDRTLPMTPNVAIVMAIW